MTEAAAERNRKSRVGRLLWPLVPALAALALLLPPADASAQVIPPQTTGNDFCSDRSWLGGSPGRFWANMPGGLDWLTINLVGSGSVGAEMYGTNALECLQTRPAACPANCRLQVQTVCEFHCAHDHIAPYGWTVQLFPTSGSFQGWPNTACIPTKGLPPSYCIVKLDDAPGDQLVWAKFGEPDLPPSAPSASVSGVESYAMRVSWTPSADDHWLGGYMIMNGATELARVGPTATSTLLQALSCRTAYNIQVVAFDARSTAASNAVPVTTGACVAGGGTRPNTVIHVKPARVTKSRRAYFHFGSAGEVRATRYQCKLDRRRWAACSGSRGKRYRNLRVGYHTFYVRAGNSVGFDRTPARYRWRIRR